MTKNKTNHETDADDSDDSDVTRWLHNLKDEPVASLEKIWHKYYKHLITYARKRLGDVPKRNFDEDDIVSSVLESFFAGVQQDRFPQLNDRTDLWKILLMMTARKAAKNIRSETAEKRGGGDVRGESAFISSGSAGGGLDAYCSPTEQFAEDFTLEMQERIASFGDKLLREVAVMKLQGYTNFEIADELDVSERTIERRLERIRALWQLDNQE